MRLSITRESQQWLLIQSIVRGTKQKIYKIRDSFFHKYARNNQERPWNSFLIFFFIGKMSKRVKNLLFFCKVITYSSSLKTLFFSSFVLPLQPKKKTQMRFQNRSKKKNYRYTVISDDDGAMAIAKEIFSLYKHYFFADYSSDDRKRHTWRWKKSFARFHANTMPARLGDFFILSHLPFKITQTSFKKIIIRIH